MKKEKFGLVMFLFAVCLNAQTPYFYYGVDEREFFELDTRYIFVSVADETTADALGFDRRIFQTDIAERNNSRTDYDARLWAKLEVGEELSDEEYLARLSRVRSRGEDVIIAPYFKNQYQDGLGLSRFLYVKLKSLSDTVLLREEIQKENAFIVRQMEFMPLWFMVSVTARSRYNAMELANNLFETGLFEHAHPSLINATTPNCANDTHFGAQWALQNIGQAGGTNGVDVKACDAWRGTTGSNVIVAVVDMGIELDHPDLIANTNPLLSYNATDNISPQNRVYGDHGTNCAGVIGAVMNNATGVAGVTPNSKLMSIAVRFNTQRTDGQLAEGILWAVRNGADIISNSWSNPNSVPVIQDAVNYAVTQGRVKNGVSLGTVMVFSSGNNNASTVYFPARLPNVIAVGAVDRCGIRSGRRNLIPNSCDPWPSSSLGPGLASNYGTALDVVAPGTNVYTTNTSGNYRDNFGGTSAAAPHVAGIAALILSRNPYLTWQEVKDIIEQTAQKMGGYTYQTTAGRPNGTWNNQVGYGMVNAHAAVLAACASTLNFTNRIVTQEININTCGTVNINNVTITSTGSLTVQAKAINIGPNFTVQSGARFNINIVP